jgi:predicted N-formylglutamate amidohydrolase
LVSIHSFTPVFRGFERPWHIGVLWDEDGRIAVPLMAALTRIDGVVVGDNQPYSERDRHGFTLRHHAGEAGLAHVLIEIRQDLIDTHHGAERWARLLAGALRPILADRAVAR